VPRALKNLNPFLDVGINIEGLIMKTEMNIFELTMFFKSIDAEEGEV